MHVVPIDGDCLVGKGKARQQQPGDQRLHPVAPQTPDQRGQESGVQAVLNHVEAMEQPGRVAAENPTDQEQWEEGERPVKAKGVGGQPDSDQVQLFGNAYVQQVVIQRG